MVRISPVIPTLYRPGPSTAGLAALAAAVGEAGTR